MAKEDKKWLDEYVRELKFRNYSPRTIKQYSSVLEKYFDFCRKNLSLERNEKVKQFIVSFGEKEGMKVLSFAALKMFYSKIVNNPVPSLFIKRRKAKNYRQYSVGKMLSNCWILLPMRNIGL